MTSFFDDNFEINETDEVQISTRRLIAFEHSQEAGAARSDDGSVPGQTGDD